MSLGTIWISIMAQPAGLGGVDQYNTEDVAGIVQRGGPEDLSFAGAMLFILLFVLALATFALFDVLVRFEYANYRSEWERDGSPHGFFWVPEEAKARFFRMFPSFRSSSARTSCSQKWLFR